MKVVSFNSNNQRNAAHYQFQTDFNNTIIKYTPHALGIDQVYSAYLPHYEDEGVAMVAITKSATTEEIRIADHDRDVTFRGLVDEVRSKLNHFRPEVRDVAKRTLVILDAYGNLAPKPDDEESGLIRKLIVDLRTKIGVEFGLLGLEDWIAELETRNDRFITLESTRNSEEAKRTSLRMKQVRLEVDAAYRAVIERINALIIVNGEAPYAEFVKEMNARIGRAQDAIAQSKAHSATTLVAETAKA
jgi:hypothetical protein